MYTPKVTNTTGCKCYHARQKHQKTPPLNRNVIAGNNILVFVSAQPVWFNYQKQRSAEIIQHYKEITKEYKAM